MLDLVNSVLARRGQMDILRIEKLTQMVEFGLTTLRRGTGYEIWRVRGDTRDEGLSIVCPPGGGGPLDRVQIGDQVGA